MMIALPPGLSTRKISLDDLARLRDVVNNAVAVHDVEARVAERHVLRVPADELALQPAQIEVFARKRYMTLGEIQIGHDCAVLCELGKVGPNPRANLQHALARMPIKLHEVRHPRPILAIAIFLDALEESETILVLGDIMRAARISVPLLLGPPACTDRA